MNIEALREIGLTESEIKVYLALFRLGQTTAGKIVDEARVTRSKIYDILERLKNKGLVGYVIKESTKYFSATSPNNILRYLNEKEEKIREEKDSIKMILPELLNQQKLFQSDKVAEVFLGMNGMRNAFDVLVEEFDSKEPYYAFGAGAGESIEQIQIFFSQLHLKRKKKRVRSFIIFNESSRGLFKDQEKSKLVKVKYIKQSTPAAINVYKNYTVIAILTREPITFLINSRETADSFREYFDIMWKVAKR